MPTSKEFPGRCLSNAALDAIFNMQNAGSIDKAKQLQPDENSWMQRKQTNELWRFGLVTDRSSVRPFRFSRLCFFSRLCLLFAKPAKPWIVFPKEHTCFASCRLAIKCWSTTSLRACGFGISLLWTSCNPQTSLRNKFCPRYLFSLHDVRHTKI